MMARDVISVFPRGGKILTDFLGEGGGEFAPPDFEK